jgi:hypothetical protein
MSDTSQSSLAAAAHDICQTSAKDQTSLQQARHDSKVHDSALDHSGSPVDALPVNSHPPAKSAQSGGAALTDTNTNAYAHNHAVLPTIDTGIYHPPLAHRVSSVPALAGLTIQTDLGTSGSTILEETKDTPSISETPAQSEHNSLASPPAYKLPARGSSLRSTLSTASIAFPCYHV